MTTENTELANETTIEQTLTSTKSSLRSEDVMKFLGPILVEHFEQTVYNLIDATQRTNAFVGLGLFKKEILPRALAHEAGKVFSDALLRQMIADGKLEVGKVANPYNSEYDTSTLKRK